MWVGIDEPCGVAVGDPEVLQPAAPRLGDRERDADGGHGRDPTLGRTGGGREADPLVDVAQGGLGDLGGLLATLLQDAAEVGLVVEQLEGAVAERGHELDDEVGQVLLQVAVPAAGVLLLEVGDRRGRSARSRS